MGSQLGSQLLLFRLKPNSSVAFTKQIENETTPTLRKQKGFQGELSKDIAPILQRSC